MTKQSINVGDRFQSNLAGMFEITSYSGWKKVGVRFLDTGYETVTQSVHVKRGKVRDHLHRSFSGVGFIGDGEHKFYIENNPTREGEVWRHMIARCYNPTTQRQSPSYIGCSVCERWHNFQNFCDDLPSLPGYADWVNSPEYSLDKDTRIPGNRIYGPEECCFITLAENGRDAAFRRFHSGE